MEIRAVIVVWIWGVMCGLVLQRVIDRWRQAVTKRHRKFTKRQLPHVYAAYCQASAVAPGGHLSSGWYKRAVNAAKRLERALRKGAAS